MTEITRTRRSHNRFAFSNGIDLTVQGDGEYWRKVWHVPFSCCETDCPDAPIFALFAAGEDPRGWYGGPGRSFAHDPGMMRGPRGWLVNQIGGLDI